MATLGQRYSDLKPSQKYKNMLRVTNTEASAFLECLVFCTRYIFHLQFYHYKYYIEKWTRNYVLHDLLDHVIFCMIYYSSNFHAILYILFMNHFLTVMHFVLCIKTFKILNMHPISKDSTGSYSSMKKLTNSISFATLKDNFHM